jgi:hypothetical protein
MEGKQYLLNIDDHKFDYLFNEHGEKVSEGNKKFHRFPIS